MFDSINAAIYHPVDQQYYFFKGAHFIQYHPKTGVVPLPNGKSIGTLGIDCWYGLPDEFTQGIDTCFFYENGNLFFFKDNCYAEWDTETNQLVKAGERKLFHIGVNKWTTFSASFLTGINTNVIKLSII